MERKEPWGGEPHKEFSEEWPYYCPTCEVFFTLEGMKSHLESRMLPIWDIEVYKKVRS